jgi:hypothetical protein
MDDQRRHSGAGSVEAVGITRLRGRVEAGITGIPAFLLMARHLALVRSDLTRASGWTIGSIVQGFLR